MKLISWNVNGLRACLGKGFAEAFAALDADIFSLQETKMQPGQADFAPDGYIEYLCSAEKKGYSGTACYTKQPPLSVRYGLGLERYDGPAAAGAPGAAQSEGQGPQSGESPSGAFDLRARSRSDAAQWCVRGEGQGPQACVRGEGRVITLEYESFFLVNCYTPNSQDGLKRLDYRLQWEDDFRAYLLALDAQKPVILCGDLNVAHCECDLKNPKANRQNAGFTNAERGKMTQLLAAGFADSFRLLHPDTIQYSWWSYRFHAREKNAGWRIDYFLVSDRIADKIQIAAIHDEIFGSDHCPVELVIDL